MRIGGGILVMKKIRFEPETDGFHGVFITVEGFPDFSIPVNLIKLVFEFVPVFLIAKLVAGIRKMKLIFCIILIKENYFA